MSYYQHPTGQYLLLAQAGHNLGYIFRPYPPEATQPQLTPQIRPPAEPQAQPAPPQPQSKEQTNCLVRDIKERCIGHYIDGQLIIETTKPLRESGVVKKKKQQQRRKLPHHAPKQQPPPPQSAPQQQQQHQPAQQSTPTPQQQLQQHHHQLQQQQLHHQQQIQQLQQQQLQQQQQQQQTPQPQPLQHQPTPQPQIQLHSPVQQQRQAQPSPTLNISAIRAEMKNWNVSDVVRFFERHEDIKQYASKFAEDEVDGRALILIIDSDQSFQILKSMLNKHGPAVKVQDKLSRYKVSNE